MKTIFANTLLAVALSTFAVAPAFAAPPLPSESPQQSPQPSESPQRTSACDPVSFKPTVQAYSKGKCLNGWKQKKTISDYKKRGLKAPGKGKKWIEVDGVYLLVNTISGIIVQTVQHR